MATAKKKSKTSRRGKGQRNYNWEKLREEWIADPELSIKLWAQRKKIPYGTAKEHLSVKEKNARKKRKNDNVIAFRKKLEDAGKGEREQQYNRALEQSIVLLEDILVGAGVEFKTALEYSHAFKGPAEIGRLAIQAAAELREISLVYQGVPGDEEDYTWPLTKNFWPHDYQRDFIFDLPSNLKARGIDAFVFAFIGGIRSGKTRCGAEKFAHLASLNRGRTLSMYAPTYPMLRDATKKTFLEVLENKGIGYINQKSDNSIILFGDTTILCRSLDRPDRNRGPEIAVAWIDEGGQLPNREAFDIVYGRVSDPEAAEPCFIFTSTADGLNYAYDVLVEEGVKNKVRLYHARTNQNISLDADYAERMKGVYDPKFAKQELGGEFIDVFSGKAYWNFSRQTNVIAEGRIHYDPMLPLILMFDLNVDPMCWNIGQRRTKGNEYVDVVLDEIHLRSASTEDAANEFVSRYSAHKGGVLIHGDATARNRQTVTTRTDYEVIKGIITDKLPLVEIRIGKTNPRVTDRIAAVNARLKDGKGHRKLFIVKEKCPETIKDFEQVKFKPGTRELDKSDPKRTHHTDAIGYYINREYPVRKIKRRAA